jgi:peptide chain release factor 1
MFERLNALKKRYDELHLLLADVKVASDRAVSQKYAKELAGLTDIVKKYQDYQTVSYHINQTELLLKEAGESKEMLDLAKNELAVLKKEKELYEKQLETMLLDGESEPDRDIIMEIRAGTGGVEASLFAAQLYRMYSRYATNNGWAIDVMNTSVNEAGGIKEIIFSIEGSRVWKRLKYESGVHRVQRVPKTEASGRIHTSAVSVAVLPEVEEIELNIDPKDLRIDVFRSAGPGGQGVNTTDSAVRITHLPTNTVVTCQDERSQIKNKAKAMKVLRARLMDDIKSKQIDKIAQKRRTQIGSGDRSEKIRTYNFPDRRATDHRIGLTIHRIDEILEGDLDEIINALAQAEKEVLLKQKK